MKRRSTAYYFAQAILFVVLIFLLPVTVWAQEITLTTVVPSFHTINLYMKGEGTVTVDGVPYTNSGAIPVKRHSSPALSVIADASYEIESVIYGEKDITDQIKQDTWVMQEIEGDISLTVQFRKRAASPPTADRQMPCVLIACAAIALAGVMFTEICYRRSVRKSR